MKQTINHRQQSRYKQTTVQLETGQKDHLKTALLAAVVTHVLFLALMPGVNVNLNEIRKNLKFTLVQPQKITPSKSPATRPEPTVSSQTGQRDVSSVADKQRKSTTLPPVAAAVISQHVIKAWARTETEQHLHTQPGVIDQFNQTFAEPITEVEETIQSYTNAYGEQHFITQLNGKDVCYMQGKPVVSDEWSADIVMFYDCHKEKKFEISAR